jgi:hypothetical protein
MTMPFHVMPFKKRFSKKWFSPQIPSKAQSPQETEHRKKEKKKRKKAPRVSSNKKGKSIFREEKTL